MSSSRFFCRALPLLACWFAGVAPLDCPAQVVQLPSVYSTSYSGTVSVPDAGVNYLGGISRSGQSTAAQGWGPYAGRAAVSGGTAGHMSLSAMIIDLKAMDDALLGNDAPPKSPPGARATGPNLHSAQHYGYAPKGIPPIDPNGWQTALSNGKAFLSGRDALQVESDVRYYLEMAENELRANRLAVARVFRRMAMERMTPELREKMTQRVKAIQAAANNPSAGGKQAEQANPVSGQAQTIANPTAPSARQF